MTVATSPGRPYLLDTSVIIHLVRGNALGQHIRDNYDLLHCQPRPLVCVVSLAEARVLSGLRHPNICAVYDFFEDQEQDVLVLELIEEGVDVMPLPLLPPTKETLQ